jgi:ornithine decarboxylase
MVLKQKLPTQFSLDYVRRLNHETPFFVIGREVLRQRYAWFRALFPDAEICYAVKANSEEHVLKTLAGAGSNFEVASIYELELLQRLKVSPERIIYGTAVKPEAHIARAYQYGVDRFAFDSIQELNHLAVAAPGARVYARAKVDDTGSVFKMSQKFGAPLNAITPLLLEAKQRGLEPYGVSFNVGSQAASAARWRMALKDIAKVMRDLQASGITIEAVNIGGGYPGEYLSNAKAVKLEDIAAAVVAGRAGLPHPVTLIMEPGRGLVSEAAILVAGVVAKIQRDDRTWLYLDAGAYNALFESMAFQGSMRYRADVVAASHVGAKPAHFVLTGPTGDGLDVISYDAVLPSSVDVGDRIVFYHVGAYSLTLASSFNGFPRAAVYAV